MTITTDIIGTIYTPGTFDSEGEVLTAAVALPGYHVNTTSPVGGWAAFKVTGGTGRRVFGGVVTHFYTFDDAIQYQAYLDTADLTAPDIPATDVPVVNGVPQSVTMRQARLALLAAGLLPTVEAAVVALPEPIKSAALIDWEFAATVDRGFGMVPMLASALGLTEAEIDDLFVAASIL